MVMPNNTEPAYLYLTTIGRSTSLPREIEIWFTRANGCYYVIAEYPTSHWVQNVKANTQVTVRLGEKRFAAGARIVDPDAEPELHGAVQQLSKEKYGWGDGTVVELKPEDGRQTQKT
jgi:deazaflavin-dependent oxidoreductase (nitroreductase family)